METMNKNKKILLFLATEKGYRVLERLVCKGKENYIASVVSFREIEMQKDYFEDIKSLAMKVDIPFFEWKDVRNSLEELLSDYCVTSCIAISWRYLLPLSINNYLEDNLIIFHDSLLPKYRGFAPLVTAVLNGDRTTGVTVLFASEMADRGEVILQKEFDLESNTHIQGVIEQAAVVYADLAEQLVMHISEGSLKSCKQDESKATYSIWRDEDDYWIDWKQSAEQIQTFIFALGYPYKGAKTQIGEDIIRITDCSIINDINFAIRTPGKIWLINNNKPIVICGSGMLCIESAVDENGSLYCFKKLRSRFGGGI